MTWITQEAERSLTEAGSASLRPVINATGVILHTNLGRAPLAASAATRAADIARAIRTSSTTLTPGAAASATCTPNSCSAR